MILLGVGVYCLRFRNRNSPNISEESVIVTDQERDFDETKLGCEPTKVQDNQSEEVIIPERLVVEGIIEKVRLSDNIVDVKPDDGLSTQLQINEDTNIYSTVFSDLKNDNKFPQRRAIEISDLRVGQRFSFKYPFEKYNSLYVLE
ncbi:hypothetical protein JXA63_04925 [Candidatus Woesebacteria bacterium]|nr:hypothetical protein [Candidatus Woesebacteria bacterium]